MRKLLGSGVSLWTLYINFVTLHSLFYEIKWVFINLPWSISEIILGRASFYSICFNYIFVYLSCKFAKVLFTPQAQILFVLSYSYLSSISYLNFGWYEYNFMLVLYFKLKLHVICRICFWFCGRFYFWFSSYYMPKICTQLTNSA